MTDLTIDEFILRRLQEMEWAMRATVHVDHRPRFQALIRSQRQIVEFHRNWPVLVEKPPVYASGFIDVDQMRFSMVREMDWMTQEQYRLRFGSEPPTAPILRMMANAWSDHPDFREEWREA